MREYIDALRRILNEDIDTMDPTLGTDTFIKPEVPKMYNVVMHNDDFTPFELVIDILMKVFRMDENSAMNLMMQVHLGRKGICGTYPFEVADQKSVEAMDMAKAHDFALLFTVEPVE